MSKALGQTYALRKTKELKLHPLNAKKGDVGAIGESIDRWGFFGAIIVQRSTGHIIAGNHRFKVAVKKGIREIPTITVDVDDQEALEILAIDNRSTDAATNDETKLSEALARLRDMCGELTGTGYSEEDLDEMVRRASERAESILEEAAAAAAPAPPTAPPPAPPPAPEGDGESAAAHRLPQERLPTISFGRRNYPLTGDEAAMLDAMVDGYVEQHGTAMGFPTAFVQAAEVGMTTTGTEDQ